MERKTRHEVRTEARRSARRRIALLAAAAAAPATMLSWAGCSSDTPAGPPAVDPGGTYGAEVTVTVVGPGRVTSSIRAIDCPTDCFERLIFDSNTADGAAGGLGLTAVTTKGARFVGWSFDTSPLGTRGRGPSTCNPISRAGASPAVEATAASITLPFGEAQGTPPAGQEGACAAYTTVPVAYNVTATFEEVIVDAGVDAADAGAGEVVFESPLAGAKGADIGVLGGRLYWRFVDTTGNSGVATGFASSSGTTTPTVVAAATGQLSAFEVDSYHVAYQVLGGNIYTISSGSSFASAIPGSSASNCVALTTDFSYAYCRTLGPGGELIQYPLSGSTPTTLYSGMPSGADLASDGTYFYLSDDQGGLSAAGTIERTIMPGTPDGGAPTFEQLVVGRTYPSRLRLGSSYLFWIDGNPSSSFGSALAALKSGGGATTMIPSTSGVRLVVPDPSSSSTAWVAIAPSTATGASEIVKVSAFGAGTTPFVSGLTGLGGIAVDSQYVYWTESDGRVRRQLKD